MLYRRYYAASFNSLCRYLSTKPSLAKSKVTMGQSYEDSITALNTLQSNANYIRNRSYQFEHHEELHTRNIVHTRDLLAKIGITQDDLNNLSIIHIAGTKGKGSTCAYCESILRQHGYKTGFYSSPHLFEVRERIRINGKPISHDKFTDYFWKVYNKLKSPENLPLEYFRFLTILAFRVFINEKVDVAVFEVGIGGEYDTTNVVDKVPVVGITSLGIDHTSLLGDTIEKIAWHKAGIMKNGAQVFTVPQPIQAMKVLVDRSEERKAHLGIVQPFLKISQANNYLPPVINVNASLAITLAHAWMKTVKGLKISLEEFQKTPQTKKGISHFSWPGRFQVLTMGPTTYYLDGAHTPESISICLKWFTSNTLKFLKTKVLIFNMIGQRDAEKMLSILVPCNFDKVIFVPNISGLSNSSDNKINDKIYSCEKCEKHREIWRKLLENNCLKIREDSISVLPTVYDALKLVEGQDVDCLITGSLHLMGAALEVLDPKLESS